MSPLRIETLVPPPSAPIAAQGDFTAVERELGTELPADWKQLVQRYGYGTFGDFLHLWSPFFEPCPMTSEVARTLGADRELAAAVSDAVPFPLHPDPQGPLPWANTDNGDVAYWLKCAARSAMKPNRNDKSTSCATTAHGGSPTTRFTVTISASGFRPVTSRLCESVWAKRPP